MSMNQTIDTNWEDKFMDEFPEMLERYTRDYTTKQGEVMTQKVFGFISKQKQLSYNQGIIEGMIFVDKNILEAFMNSYCEHGKQNKERCEKCGRAILGGDK